MRALLDVNVLIALLDAAHSAHTAARAWLSQNIDEGWASCPITQNGLVRIMSQSGYPHAISPTQAAALLRDATATGYHQFWADDVSLLDPQRFDTTRLHGARQITDAYLLALAVKRRGRFVTFDSAVPTGAVPSASDRNLVVLR
ncbi:MAG: TA system VapC family ribonuclease toxin [Lysobacterales bacterium]